MTVAWFSCGAASAVAAKIALEVAPSTVVARCIVANEHPDNDRFARDVEVWLGRPVVNLRSEKYADCWEVWEKRRYLNGPAGALCTVEMKKKVRQRFAPDPATIHVFGYTVEESKRLDHFRENNPDAPNVWCPLIDRGLTKADCFAVLTDAGIELPAMYRLGYHNANCIGCVKGGAGYWNKIRRDFPEVFARMDEIERALGRSCIKGRPLRELPPDAGRHTDLELPDCGLFCGQNEGAPASSKEGGRHE